MAPHLKCKTEVVSKSVGQIVITPMFNPDPDCKVIESLRRYGFYVYPIKDEGWKYVYTVRKVGEKESKVISGAIREVKVSEGTGCIKVAADYNVLALYVDVCMNGYSGALFKNRTEIFSAYIARGGWGFVCPTALEIAEEVLRIVPKLEEIPILAEELEVDSNGGVKQ